MGSGEGQIALEELLTAQTTAKQMPLRNGGDRRIGTFLFDVREFREDAVEDEQVRVTPGPCNSRSDDPCVIGRLWTCLFLAFRLVPCANLLMPCIKACCRSLLA